MSTFRVEEHFYRFIVSFLECTKKFAAEWEEDRTHYIVYVEHDAKKSQKILEKFRKHGFEFMGAGKKGKHYKFLMRK